MTLTWSIASPVGGSSGDDSDGQGLTDVGRADRRRDAAPRHDGRHLARLRPALLGRHSLRAEAGDRLALVVARAGQCPAQHDRRDAEGGGEERRRGLRQLRPRISRRRLRGSAAGDLRRRRRRSVSGRGHLYTHVRDEVQRSSRRCRSRGSSITSSTSPRWPASITCASAATSTASRRRRPALEDASKLPAMTAGLRARLRAGRRREDPRRQRAAGAGGERAAGRVVMRRQT